MENGAPVGHAYPGEQRHRPSALACVTFFTLHAAAGINNQKGPRERRLQRTGRAYLYARDARSAGTVPLKSFAQISIKLQCRTHALAVGLARVQVRAETAGRDGGPGGGESFTRIMERFPATLTLVVGYCPDSTGALR
jgi:hypothetical protein